MTVSGTLVRRSAALVASAALVLGVAGCAPAKPEVVPSDTAEAVVTVVVADNVYTPAEVEIAVGDAVRWVFEGSVEHDVVAGDGSFVSELVKDGEYTHVFDEAGVYAYDCSVHPEMRGTITVR